MQCACCSSLTAVCFEDYAQIVCVFLGVSVCVSGSVFSVWLLFPTVSCCYGDSIKHVLFVYLPNYILHNPNVLFSSFFVNL